MSGEQRACTTMVGPTRAEMCPAGSSTSSGVMSTSSGSGGGSAFVSSLQRTSHQQLLLLRGQQHAHMLPTNQAHAHMFSGKRQADIRCIKMLALIVSSRQPDQRSLVSADAWAVHHHLRTSASASSSSPSCSMRSSSALNFSTS